MAEVELVDDNAEARDFSTELRKVSFYHHALL